MGDDVEGKLGKCHHSEFKMWSKAFISVSPHWHPVVKWQWDTYGDVFLKGTLSLTCNISSFLIFFKKAERVVLIAALRQPLISTNLWGRHCHCSKCLYFTTTCLLAETRLGASALYQAVWAEAGRPLWLSGGVTPPEQYCIWLPRAFQWVQTAEGGSDQTSWGDWEFIPTVYQQAHLKPEEP